MYNNNKRLQTELYMPLSKIFMNNKYEGTRLGFGLLTNERISKHFELAGYAGYGFKDEVWKYGGRALVHLDKYNEVQLEYSYRNDLREAGSSVENSIWRPTSNEYLRKFLGYRFDACEEHRAEFSLGLSGSLNFRHCSVQTNSRCFIRTLTKAVS